MGLNESYVYARSEIFLTSLVPSVNQANSILVNDECQRATTSSNSSMRMNSICAIGVDPLVMFSRSSGLGHPTNKFKKSFGVVVCDFCRCRGHSKD